MSGGGSVIKSIVRDVKNVTKSAESAVKVAGAVFNPYGTALEGGTKFLTGKKSSGIFRSMTAAGAQAGESLVDKPKAAKEAFKRASAEAKSMQEAQLKKIEKRKAQEGAESAASDELLRRRARQRRRAGGTGRESTILSADLGNVGGSTGGRKNLLGL